MNSENKIISIFKDYPLAVFSVVVTIICVAAIFVRGGATQELLAAEADLNSRIRVIDQNVKNAKDLEQEVDEVNLLVERISSRLFNRDQRAVNINFFYALEQRLGVRIVNIAQMPAEDPVYIKGGPKALKLHSTINYSISLKGTFAEILAFLYELHRVEPLIRVADFQVAAGGGQASVQGVLDARLRLIVLAER